jgi:hypothetical protein
MLMKNDRLATSLLSLALVLFPATSNAVLEVTLDSGLGTQVFTDVDADGDVDFDVTVDGVFYARATAREDLDPLKARVALAPLAPNLTALFRNDSASQQTFTVTVRSAAFGAPIAAPVGWIAFYHATADDLVDMAVDIPSHSVTAKVNGNAITLGSAAGLPLLSTSGIDVESSAVDPVNAATDVSIVWTFTLGANDEIRFGSDNGFDGDSIQVNVFNQTQKCVDKMNNNARKVGDAAQKSDVKCTKEEGMDVTACVDDEADEKVDKKIQKLVDDYASQCDPVPAWGVNDEACCVGGTGDGDPCIDSATCGGGTCSAGGCIAAATDGAANDLAHDLFGPAVVISADKDTAKCQGAAAKAVGKLYAGRWKSFRKCKKDNFAAITGDLFLRSTCLEPQPDADSKISRLETKVSDAFQKKCVDKGLTGIGAFFPGACTGEGDLTIATCAVRQARCRFCLSANDADAIVPEVDCDDFDDAIANATCP